MFESFCEIIAEKNRKFDEPMFKHTTFRTGGKAKLFLEPESIDEVEVCIKHCLKKNYPYIVIGAGSNLLVSDKGYDGVIIKIGNKIKKCEINGTSIHAEAGIGMAEIARKAADAGLTGLEFAEGIPGKLGGGLFMNAGAYGGELNDLVKSVKAVNLLSGNQEIITNIKGETFGYRTSYFQKKPYVILSAELELRKGNTTEIKEKIRELSQRRRNNQPLEYPSAGSTFKRPKEEGKYAGALIEQAGLKGYHIGGAQVSEKHAGFIINYNQATSTDVWNLIQYVIEKVYQHSGIKLEPEVRFIGEFV